jgi:hypothetical protein
MFVVFALLMLAAPAGQSVGEPVLSQILERVAHYVRRFEDQFALVVSDEEYEQKDVVAREGRIRSRLTRRMRSEMMFAWLPEQETWLIARHVLVVDGAPVHDGAEPLDALSQGGPEVRTRLRRLRDEGARFNIGSVYRNFNDPTLVLQFLDPTYQSRFTFSMMGKEKVNGVDAWKIAFAEGAQPTLIQTPTSDLLSNGLIWIDRADRGVVRTSLTIKDATTNTRADIVVDYRANAKLDLSVPARMVESYEQQSIVNRASPGAPPWLVTMRERIECVATYSNYRRFETSGRLVPPSP